MKIDTTSGEFDFTYLSLGAGVQSSALLVLACRGQVPKPAAAIFADTGDEPPWVYEYVDVLTRYAEPFGIPVVRTQKGVLSEQLVGRSLVPFYTGSNGDREGMLLRKCSTEYKLEPIRKKVRELLGYEPRKRVRERVRAMLGITRDEAQRMKPSSIGWITNTYPLVDLGMTRHSCMAVVADAGLPEPQKSACYYCPYHSDTYWQWMKDTHPEQFMRAVAVDAAVRDLSAAGVQHPAYLHRSCKPLLQVSFDATDPNQVDMWAECEGICGV